MPGVSPQAEVVAAVRAASTHGAVQPVVLIDGGSGSGKTSLARAVVELWGAQGASAWLISLDDIYPGWDGPEAAGRHIVDHVLAPRAAGAPAAWQRWDWIADAPAEWHTVPPGIPLVIEGCGALSESARSLASLGVWVELDAATRRTRAIARDGDLFAPHWDRWAAQEERFGRREHPRDRADLCLDGLRVESRSMVG
ncbi:MAG: hypothetical protein H7146_10845 [Burkholderiaceae bacterium]|nr:hypothetical protein [Microbacteriaceae bacterium]